MGDRSHIVIRNGNPNDTITLYGHWAGTTNIEAVERVLARTTRKGDISYLTAELFYEFAVVQGSFTGVGAGGFGIWAGDDTGAWADNPSVYVDANDGTYTYDRSEPDEDEEVSCSCGRCFDCQQKAVFDQNIIHH